MNEFATAATENSIQIPALEDKEAQTADTLKALQDQVLALPGAEYYLQFGPEAIKRLVADVMTSADAKYTNALIMAELGWSQAEAAAFAQNPLHHPYESHIEFAQESAARKEQYIVIGKYLRALHEFAQGKPDQEQIAQDLRTYLEATTFELFLGEEQKLKDREQGILPGQREAGIVSPHPEVLALITAHAQSVAAERGIDTKDLEQQVFALTEGYINFMTMACMTLQLSPEVSAVLERVLQEWTTKNDTTVDTIHLLAKVEGYRKRMGLSFEEVVTLGGFPGIATTKEKLHAYLQDPALAAEIWSHLDNEAPEFAQQARSSSASLSEFEIWNARAQHADYPKGLESLQELETKVAGIHEVVKQLFPLGYADEATNIVEASPKPQASVRPATLFFTNTAGQQITIVRLNPRWDGPKLLEDTAHEKTHNGHSIVIEHAQEAGNIPKESFVKMNTSVKEFFAELIDKQVAQIWQEVVKNPVSEGVPLQAEEEAGEDSESETVPENPAVEPKYPNLYTAVGVRRQAPYALAQIEARQMLDELFEKQPELAENGISSEQAQEIGDTLKQSLEGWYKEGIAVLHPVMKVNNRFCPVPVQVDWQDGVAYLADEIVTAQEESDEGNSDDTEAEPEVVGQQAEVALKERFGEHWLTKADARIVIYSLMVEAVQNPNIATYADYILHANIEELRAQLESWKIDATMIGQDVDLGALKA